MNDAIAALESLEPESPPREVVLSALRLFRYRAIAAVAVIALAIGALVWIAQIARGSTVNPEAQKVVEDSRAAFQPAAGSAMVGTVRVTATEVASAPSGHAVRLVFEDVGTPEPVVDLDVAAIRQGSAELGPVVSIQSLGRREGRSSTAAWVPLDERADPFTASIEILVLPIPDSILDEGGELTSDDGFTGVVTIERPTQQ